MTHFSSSLIYNVEQRNESVYKERKNNVSEKNPETTKKVENNTLLVFQRTYVNVVRRKTSNGTNRRVKKNARKKEYQTVSYP